MKTILHVMTRQKDPLAEEMIAAQQKMKEISITVIDLNGPNPDYEKLLHEIFKSDSIEVW